MRMLSQRVAKDAAGSFERVRLTASQREDAALQRAAHRHVLANEHSQKLHQLQAKRQMLLTMLWRERRNHDWYEV